MPQPLVISNNTPLSGLWSIGQLSLLHQLYGEITIPEQVAREFVATDTTVRQKELNEASWLTISPLQNDVILETFGNLDDGEAAVLTLALEQPTRLVIMDERRGRQFAKRLNLPHTGTVGILLEAKQAGYISEVKPLLHQLVANGFYLGEAIVQKAIQLANEQP